jgi:diguanylate cyclase (GGDEF)-like protein/PAS domain S-box-containing protein
VGPTAVWQGGGPLAALLFVAAGVVTLLSPLLPSPDGLRGGAVAVIGTTAVVAGLVLLRLPWHRWSPSLPQVLLVPALALIGAHNHFGGIDPYRYAVFFVIAFMWLGLTQPRWASLRWVVPLAVAYGVPLALADAPVWAWSSLLYSTAICVIVAETLAWTVDRLRLAERRFRALVRHAPSLITVLDREGVVTFESEQMAELLGVDPRERVGGEALDDVHPDDRDLATEVFLRMLAAPDASESCEIRTRSANGWRWAEVTFTNLLHEPAVAGIVANWRDVTERHDLEEQLKSLAYTDVLTGLPNRSAFHERLRGAVARSVRNGTSLALLFVDLDGFKSVNDSFGHETGDDLLRQVAKRMLAVRRQSEVLARIGGDEFVLLLEDLRSPADARAAAGRMRTAFAEAFVLPAGVVRCGASVGVAVSDPERPDASALLREADAAMYRDKHDRPGRDLSSA